MDLDPLDAQLQCSRETAAMAPGTQRRSLARTSRSRMVTLSIPQSRFQAIGSQQEIESTQSPGNIDISTLD